MSCPSPLGPLARAETAVWRRLPDGVLLLPAKAADPFEVSGPGAALWDLLEQPLELNDIIDTLAEVYSADAATVRDDLEPVLAHLEATGAVSRLSSR